MVYEFMNHLVWGYMSSISFKCPHLWAIRTTPIQYLDTAFVVFIVHYSPYICFFIYSLQNLHCEVSRGEKYLPQVQCRNSSKLSIELHKVRTTSFLLCHLLWMQFFPRSFNIDVINTIHNLLNIRTLEILKKLVIPFHLYTYMSNQ